MEAIKIQDTTKINDYKEVDKLELSTITKNDGDKELLSGMIISGYEMKFGSVNENREKYDKGAFEKYIDKYFVKNKLNIPVTILHMNDMQHLAGRVLVAEINKTGLYFVVYIPKSYPEYQNVLNKIKEGILQGFSKDGWATDYEYIYLPSGEFDYMLIKEMMFSSLSIVATPANALSFEKIKETKITNATKLITDANDKKTDIIDELFS
jgi:hypothetical protein